MRKINAWIYVTLDGVMEAPENWVIPDDEMFGAMETDYASADALLLGRRTYEVFAASWPQRSSDEANVDWMNNTPKFVASTTLTSVEWQNSTLIKGDVSEAISKLKREDGKNIMVNGSATLVRSLLRDNLLDELRLFVHPVVMGSGGRLFEDGGDQVKLELADTRTYENGVVSLTYQPTNQGE
jgi:dihydrofolate reductase